MGRRGWKSLDTPTGWVQIIRGPRPPSVQWPRVGQQSRQPVTSVTNEPPDVSSGEVFSPPTVPRPQCQSGSREGTSLQVGDSIVRDGWHGGARGGHGTQCPQTGVGGSARDRDRRPGERVRVILGKSPFPSGGAGFQACDHHPKHRVFREKVGGIEGTTNHDVTAGRFFRSSPFAGQGGSVAGTSRQLQDSPECGLSRSKSQAHMSPGRVRSTLRRRDARVDRGATEGSPGGHSGRATPRCGKDLPTLVQGSGSGNRSSKSRPQRCRPQW